MNPADLGMLTSVAFKLFVLLGLAIYAIFAGVMVRQEQLMAKTFKDATEPLLRVATIVHFAAAVFVIVLAVIFL